MSSPAVSSPGAARFTVREELARLLRLAWPVVVARLGIMAMGLTDVIVVGHYSATQLGYHALGWAPTSVVLTMMIGLLTGIQVMTARLIGEGRREAIGAVLRRGLAYSVWVGLASMVVLFVGGPPFMHAVGLDRYLADGASAVLQVFALSMPFYGLSVAASFWLEGQGRPGPGAVMMWIANIVNLALALILVPGLFGFPELGAVGAAWATMGARVFLTVAMLGYIALSPQARALGVFTKPARDIERAAEQRRIGYGAGASNFFEVAAFAGMNVIAGRIGGLEVAAWAIVLNAVAIVFMVPMGLSTAAAVTVGGAYGARDAAALKRSALVAFAVTAVFGLAAALVMAGFAGPLARAYTGDAATIALAAPAMALAALFLLPDALQVVVAQSLRARGDILTPTLTHLASYVLLMAPLAWWLAITLRWGLSGIVWAVTLASLVSAGLLLTRFWILGRRGL